MFAFKLHWIKLLHIAEDRVWNPNLLLTNSPKESVSQGYITKLWVPLSNPINAGILCYSTIIKPIPPWLREVEVLEDYVKVLTQVQLAMFWNQGQSQHVWSIFCHESSLSKKVISRFLITFLPGPVNTRPYRVTGGSQKIETLCTEHDQVIFQGRREAKALLWVDKEEKYFSWPKNGLDTLESAIDTTFGSNMVKSAPCRKVIVWILTYFVLPQGFQSS